MRVVLPMGGVVGIFFFYENGTRRCVRAGQAGCCDRFSKMSAALFAVSLRLDTPGRSSCAWVWRRGGCACLSVLDIF
jgi:hypothetical protein